MLTIFTIPKPFIKHVNIIQRNAIKSWINLVPNCDVILFGDDEGVEEVAAELGTKHVAGVPKNKFGTPLLNFVFDHAQKLASYENVCYMNADIILFKDFLGAVNKINFKKFLMVGQRWDIDITEPWNFESADWEKMLRGHVTSDGVLHPPSGSDYFVFPKGVLGKFLPFAVGRPGWDTWVIYHARRKRIPVIDASRVTTVVHQNHGYGHVSYGRNETSWGIEGDRNIYLMGGWDNVFTLRDANWILTESGVSKPQWTPARFIRFIYTLPVLHPYLRPIFRLARSFLNFYRSIKYAFVHLRIKNAVKRSPLKVVIGSASVGQPDWVSTDIEHVDLLIENSWAKYFAEGSIDAILAEHVWEHLTLEEAHIATKICFKYLKKGGYLRVAVPDGFHLSTDYIEAVKPGGIGADSEGHKVLYNYKTLSKGYQRAGFEVQLLEWFDEDGHFHQKEWHENSGLIRRSSKFDKRNKDGKLNYTSIILDAWKR